MYQLLGCMGMEEEYDDDDGDDDFLTKSDRQSR
jgi:hypothetical protein